MEKDQLVTTCDRFRPLKHSSSIPRAFTEQGIAMLSSVLNSGRAIEVNIAIMRAFVQLRRVSTSQNRLAEKFREVEVRLGDHDEEIQAIFEAIRQLLAPQPESRKRKIGFEVKEPKARYGKKGRKSGSDA